MAEKEKVQVPEKVRGHDNIHAALSAFQGELKTMPKTGHVEFPTKSGNGVVKFDYTPLGEIMSTIYPLLAKHGLAVRHEVTKEGVEAILTHESYAEKREVALEEYTPVNDAQRSVDLKQRTYITATQNELRSGIVKISTGGEMKDTGAAITYARRYTLTMLLGISSEDDKDAELLEQSAKNAIQTVYDRFKTGIGKAKTPAEVEKQMTVLQKDLKALEGGKAPALGLAKEQYEELISIGTARVDELKKEDPTVGE